MVETKIVIKVHISLLGNKGMTALPLLYWENKVL